MANSPQRTGVLAAGILLLKAKCVMLMGFWQTRFVKCVNSPDTLVSKGPDENRSAVSPPVEKLRNAGCRLLFLCHLL
jgi:hypothetical protein